MFADWEKAKSRLEHAITAARALIETTAKVVLNEMGIHYLETWDLPKPCHEAASGLGILAKQHSDVLFNAIFGACETIVTRVGEMRNKFGDAHGRGNLTRQVPRGAAAAFYRQVK